MHNNRSRAIAWREALDHASTVRARLLSSLVLSMGVLQNDHRRSATSMKTDEINSKLRENQVTMVLAVKLKEGHRQLFDAACWDNNGKQAADIRQKMHDLLDKELDCSSIAMTLTRRLLESGGF